MSISALALLVPSSTEKSRPMVYVISPNSIQQQILIVTASNEQLDFIDKQKAKNQGEH
jgi:hypothetical protein